MSSKQGRFISLSGEGTVGGLSRIFFLLCGPCRSIEGELGKCTCVSYVCTLLDRKFLRFYPGRRLGALHMHYLNNDALTHSEVAFSVYHVFHSALTDTGCGVEYLLTCALTRNNYIRTCQA